MLIDKSKKRRKLSHEILIIVAICFALSLLLYLLIAHLLPRIVEEYCFSNGIMLDDYQFFKLDIIMYKAGIAISVLFFIVMFFILFGERLAYIRKITAGVEALRDGHYGNRVELVGNNELTELAEAVNYLSESEQKIKAAEKRLNEEKEELIRTLSHDIRTPLTAMMSYTELFAAKKTMSAEEQQEYLALVTKKTKQIKELTDILLDGGKREVEQFEDARLLFEQLTAEFEEALEDKFKLSVTIPAMPFSCSFDVGELRRIFDNLISNIRKYAEPAEEVQLFVSKDDSGIVINQCNAIKKDRKVSESYKMGLHSIRRIAQNYGGTIEISESEDKFEIIIRLSNI